MKKNCLFLTISLLLIHLTSAQRLDFATEMEGLMVSMKRYTLALADQMPVDKFEYKPSESAELRTFSQHFKHMRNFIEFQLMLLKNEDLSDFRDLLQRNKAYELGSQEKEKVLEDLSKQFDEVISFYQTTNDRNLVETFTFFFEDKQPVRSRRLISMALRDHISHHRAQSIIYLRENGITPTAYQRY